MIHEYRILSDEQVAEIQSQLSSTKRWVDGSVSASYSSDIKKNFELDKSKNEINKAIATYIEEFFRKNPQVYRKFSFNQIQTPIVSKLTKGCYYRPHQDNPQNGHFSTTLFLSNPEDYDGGYLRIYDGSEIRQFKPKAGYAVTYSTTFAHEVSTVTEGVRMAAVYWTHSPFAEKDYFKDIYYLLFDLLDVLSDDDSEVKVSSLEEALASPGFLIDTICNKYQKLVERNFKG